MDWAELIKSEMEEAYRATEGLMDLVDEDKLEWQPESGESWMPTRQLLRHLTDACGWCCENFVHDRWQSVMQGEQAMPLEEVSGVAEAKAGLAKDKQRAFAAVDAAAQDLGTKLVTAPWDPTPKPLGQHLLQMVAHLNQHKAQLFYYLKLQGKPVNTFTMWGLPEPQPE